MACDILTTCINSSGNGYLNIIDEIVEQYLAYSSVKANMVPEEAIMAQQDTRETSSGEYNSWYPKIVGHHGGMICEHPAHMILHTIISEFSYCRCWNCLQQSSKTNSSQVLTQKVTLNAWPKLDGISSAVMVASVHSETICMTFTAFKGNLHASKHSEIWLLEHPKLNYLSYLNLHLEEDHENCSW